MNPQNPASSFVYDIIIVGAGISGINSAYRVQTQVPSAAYTILEMRNEVGGTWDLFRYPGVRSDSELHTFGFTWQPWAEEKALAGGEAIRNYIRTSAERYGIDRKIRFQHKLVSATWSSEQHLWTLSVDAEGKKKHFYTRFVLLSTGYYDYDEALSPQIPGIEKFRGKVLHPQSWDTDYDYTGKKIVVIGSGATAVTLIPKLAEKACHVTMLQRSPTYILSRPAVDPIGRLFRSYFPIRMAQRMTRFKNLVLGYLIVKFCAWYPLRARAMIKEATVKQLPEDVPYDPHFKPRYNPWEQRLCACPDGDFFTAMRQGKSSVVTDSIVEVTETGISLSAGKFLEADAIVTATGLKLKTGGGAQFYIDKEPVSIAEKFLWRSMMLQDIPNLAMIFGYANLSWTLGADATALLLCRLMNYMNKKGITSATPKLTKAEEDSLETRPTLNLSSTYVARGVAQLPKSGNKAPWLPRSSYFSDWWSATFGSITLGVLFEKVSS
ncbi:hypothetical protein MMC17_002652 [Xylographa soralifera]|nr:hypothetical protein [Xylographa soralifera]